MSSLISFLPYAYLIVQVVSDVYRIEYSRKKSKPNVNSILILISFTAYALFLSFGIELFTAMLEEKYSTSLAVFLAIVSLFVGYNVTKSVFTHVFKEIKDPLPIAMHYVAYMTGAEFLLMLVTYSLI